MKWRDLRRSRNVETRGRARGAGRLIGGGGIVGVIVIALTLFFPELRGLLGDVATTPAGSGGSESYSHVEDPNAGYAEAPVAFTERVLGSTEDVWGAVFAEGAFPSVGRSYPQLKLVVFEGVVSTSCGVVNASSGPFYCPGDQSIFVDRTFFQVLGNQLDAPGDFAAAFVIAHEVGHHVQNLTGVLGRLRSPGGESANRVSVRTELQADCYAGVWARRADRRSDVLEPGDIQEGLRAAHQVGDDVIMRMGGRPVNEEAFTHGSSEQRMRWFRRGYSNGDVADCDTFAVAFSRL